MSSLKEIGLPADSSAPSTGNSSPEGVNTGLKVAPERKHAWGDYDPNEEPVYYSLPWMKALKNHLPIAAEALETTVDKLSVYEPYGLRNFMIEDDLKDRAIKTLPIAKGFPYIKSSRLHASIRGTGGVGAVLYETRDKSLRYVTYYFTTGSNTFSFLIVPKGKMFRLKRHFDRLNKQKSLKHPPVLRDGLLAELVRNSVDFLMAADEIETYGVKIKRGLMLHGLPGNGKTMACKWIKKLCDERNITHQTITASMIMESFGKNELTELIGGTDLTFFDDIDISFLSRTNDDMSAKIACALLAAMDGIDRDSHSVKIFTTNEEVESIDIAFRRPGRIDRCLIFDKPTYDLRKQLIDSWPKEITTEIEPVKIAESTAEFSFAEVEAVRSLLVTNKLFGNGNWDLDVAVKDFHTYSSDLGRSSTGFFSNNNN